MKKLILQTLLLTTTVVINAQTSFQKTFAVNVVGGGNPAIDNGKSVARQTSDGGYIIAGTTSLGVGSTDGLLIKTNSFGDTLWTKTYGGAADNEYVYDAIQTLDGGYVFAGKTYSFGNGWFDAYITKVDANGNIIWSKTIGGAQNDLVRSIIQLADGNFVAAGETGNFGQGGLDMYLIKLDASGNLLWTRTYGGTGTDYGYQVIATTDNGFLFTGYTGSFGIDFWDMYVVKTDSTGNLLWGKTFGAAAGGSEDRAYTAVQTSDGGYAIAGYTTGLGTAGLSDIYLVKLNNTGTLLWSKTYGSSDNDRAFSIVEAPDNGLVMVGERHLSSPNNFILKTDAAGVLLWVKMIGTTTSDIIYNVAPVDDLGYIILAHQGSNLLLIKTDSLGESGCNQNDASGIIIESTSLPTTIVNTGGIQSTGGNMLVAATLTTKPVTAVSVLCSSVLTGINQKQSLNEISIYPNPSNGNYTVIIANEVKESHSIAICDAQGKIVFEKLSNEKTIQINLSNNLPGIYLVKIQTGNKVVTKKIIYQ